LQLRAVAWVSYRRRDHSVVANAGHSIRVQGISERCGVVAGDLLKARSRLVENQRVEHVIAALSLLREAVAHGQGLQLETDPDLKSLHSDPRFNALVAKAKEQAAAH
jgi:hypothetical protein